MSKKDKDDGIIKLVKTGQDEMEEYFEDLQGRLEKEQFVGFIFAAKTKDGGVVSCEAGDLTVFENMALCSYLQSKANYDATMTELVIQSIDIDEE